MAVRWLCVLVLTLVITASALDNLDNAGLRVAIRVLDECTKSDGIAPCLKKKAITFLDRLGKIQKLDITDEISIVQASNIPANATSLNEDQLEKTLPRNIEARNSALSDMLWNKLISFVRSRNIEFCMPRLSDIEFAEARKGDIGFGGGGGGKGGKKKGGKKGGGLMMGMMLGMMGKMMALIPIGIAGLFLLAGKALITSKIALLISGIIAIKKLVASKQGGGGGHGGGGHGGGGGHHVSWSSSGGGGWDKRSLDESHKLAYSSYVSK